MGSACSASLHFLSGLFCTGRRGIQAPGPALSPFRKIPKSDLWILRFTEYEVHEPVIDSNDVSVQRVSIQAEANALHVFNIAALECGSGVDGEMSSGNLPQSEVQFGRPESPCNLDVAACDLQPRRTRWIPSLRYGPASQNSPEPAPTITGFRLPRHPEFFGGTPSSALEPSSLAGSFPDSCKVVHYCRGRRSRRFFAIKCCGEQPVSSLTATTSQPLEPDQTGGFR